MSSQLNIPVLQANVSLKEKTYEILKDAISKMNIYAPDAHLRLDERQLSEQLGISRTPLREALVRLEDRGRRVSGRAQEPRWSQGWARHDGGVVLLERVPRAKRNAVVICLLKAYRKARAAWRNGEARNGNEPDNKVHEEIVA